MGEPVSREHCSRVLKASFRRQRIAAAPYFCLLQPGTPMHLRLAISPDMVTHMKTIIDTDDQQSPGSLRQRLMALFGTTSRQYFGAESDVD